MSHRTREAIVALAVGAALGLVLVLGLVVVHRPAAVAASPMPTASPAVAHHEPVTPQVKPASPAFLVLADATVDHDWQVARSVEAWNRALGCRLFVTLGDGHSTYDAVTVAEGPALLDGKPMRGVTTTGQTVVTIELNRKYGVDWHVTMHELGHVAGLEHDADPAGIMNVDAAPGGKVRVATTVDGPSAAELAKVRALQASRCGR